MPGTIPGSFEGSNVGIASTPDPETATSSHWRNTAWWSFTPSDDMRITIHATSSDMDPALDLYTANPAAPRLVANDDGYGWDGDAMLTVDLIGGTEYRLGLGSWYDQTGTATISLSGDVPGAPTDLVASVAIDGSVQLDWTAADDKHSPITRYDIFCTPEGSPETPCTAVNGWPPDPAAWVHGLSAGVPHTFRVEAVNSNGSSTSSASVSAVPASLSSTTTPSAPTYGDTVTVTATVVPAPSPDAGIVRFETDDMPVGSPVPLEGGTAQIVLTDLEAGFHMVGATFSGGGGVRNLTRWYGLSVGKADQVIDTGAIPAVATVGSTLTTSATATSGLPVSVTAAGTCAVAAGFVTFTAAGTCTLTFGQAGNANWNAARSVDASIVVVGGIVPPGPPASPPTPPTPPAPPAPPSLPTAPAEALSSTAAGSIHRLYLGLFGRVADQPGLAHWVTRHDDGLPMSTIVQRFTASAEWRRQHGEVHGPALVDLLYRIVLGREADTGGRAHWIEQLRTGRLTEAQLISLFADSGEMLERIRVALAVR